MNAKVWICSKEIATPTWHIDTIPVCSKPPSDTPEFCRGNLISGFSETLNCPLVLGPSIRLNVLISHSTHQLLFPPSGWSRISLCCKSITYLVLGVAKHACSSFACALCFVRVCLHGQGLVVFGFVLEWACFSRGMNVMCWNVDDFNICVCAWFRNDNFPSYAFV